MSKEKRFDTWSQPNIKDGALTQWNWMVQNLDKFILGKNTDIGAFTYINAKFGVEIRDEVQIGSHCAIYSYSSIDNKSGKVILEKNCRVGSHSTIMPGVTIGKNTVIGAHSFVNESIPSNVVAVGSPVSIIKEIQIND